VSAARAGLAASVVARSIRDARGDTDVVITTMGMAREWMALGPLGPLDFVFVPSAMGHATSLGFGLALARPDRRVIVANGDGSMLMNLGSLVTIAAARPSNLVVIVCDNGAYEVTGAQPTPGAEGARSAGDRVDYGALARATGFVSVFRCPGPAEWDATLAGALAARGPTFLWVDVTADATIGGPRSPGPAPDRARRFMAALAENR
jgi:phosphonopyruvate decarboxylase